MKEKDKKVEEFIEKVFSETTLETPSFDFTSKIMAQVTVLEQRKIKEYKPLISKPVWFAIFLILVTMMSFAVFGTSEKTQFDFDFSAKMVSLIPSIHFSDATTYSVLIVTMMVLIQIPLLKNYFEKRFEV